MSDQEQPVPPWLSTSAAVLSAAIILFKLAQPDPSVQRKPLARTAEELGDRQREVTQFKTSAYGIKDILLATYNGISNDRVTALAAASTYYVLLAIFPALAAIVAIYGLFSNPSEIGNQLSNLQDVLPSGALTVIRDELQRIVSQSTGTLSFAMAAGLLIALWSANSGVKALFDSLNQVYDERERRSFIKLNLIALTFTIGSIIFLAIAVAAIVALPVALNYIGPSEAAAVTSEFIRWPLLLLVITMSLAVLYRFGPSRKDRRWKWVSWGSGAAAVLWLAASLLFSSYAANFGSFNKTYGSLGAIIGFMVWIWVSMIVVLLGAELDAQMQKLAAGRNSTEPHQH